MPTACLKINTVQIEKKSFIWAKAKSAQREGQELSNKAPHKLLALLGQEFHEKICKEKSYVLSKITVWTACFFMPVTAVMCMSVKKQCVKEVLFTWHKNFLQISKFKYVY